MPLNLPLPSSNYLEGLDQTVASARDARERMRQFMLQHQLAQEKAQREKELQPYELEKLKSEAAEKNAAAEKAKMIINALKEIEDKSSASNGKSITDKQKALKDKLISLGVIKESPSDIAEREIKTAEAKEESKLKNKKAEEYLGTGEIVNKYAPNLKKIHNLLEKNESLTGNVAGLRNMLHLSNEEQGEFNAAALPLTGKLAKDISQRGGAVAANLAQMGKPGIWTSHAGNKGLTKQLISAAIQDFNEAKNNYEKATGKPYPHKLDPFLAQMSSFKVRSPDNKIISFSDPTKGEAFLKLHPDHERIE